MQQPPARDGKSGTRGMTILLALGLSSMIACASNPKARVVTAYQVTETALGSLQDTEIQIFKSGLVPELTPERHKAIQGALVPVFDAQIRLGHGLLAWQPGTTPPVGFDQWIATIENSVVAIKAAVPSTGASKLWASALEWIDAVINSIKAIGQAIPNSLLALKGTTP